MVQARDNKNELVLGSLCGKERMGFKNIQEIRLARFGEDWMLEMEEEEEVKMTPHGWLQTDSA